MADAGSASLHVVPSLSSASSWMSMSSSASASRLPSPSCAQVRVTTLVASDALAPGLTKVVAIIITPALRTQAIPAVRVARVRSIRRDVRLLFTWSPCEIGPKGYGRSSLNYRSV